MLGRVPEVHQVGRLEAREVLFGAAAADVGGRHDDEVEHRVGDVLLRLLHDQDLRDLDGLAVHVGHVRDADAELRHDAVTARDEVAERVEDGGDEEALQPHEVPLALGDLGLARRPRHARRLGLLFEPIERRRTLLADARAAVAVARGLGAARAVPRAALLHDLSAAALGRVPVGELLAGALRARLAALRRGRGPRALLLRGLAHGLLRARLLGDRHRGDGGEGGLGRGPGRVALHVGVEFRLPRLRELFVAHEALAVRHLVPFHLRRDLRRPRDLRPVRGLHGPRTAARGAGDVLKGDYLGIGAAQPRSASYCTHM